VDVVNALRVCHRFGGGTPRVISSMPKPSLRVKAHRMDRAVLIGH